MVKHPKAYRSLLLLLALALLTACQPPATPPFNSPPNAPEPIQGDHLPAGTVKWHPGHYLRVDTEASESQLRTLLSPPARFRGLQVFFHWRMLEPRRDAYDFSKVRAAIATAERLGTRIVIEVETQAYHQGRSHTPDYITGPEFGGGTYVSPIGATNPVAWNAAVAERIAKLYRALGAAFNRHPLVEAVTTMETSTPTESIPPTVEPYTEQKALASFLTMARALREAFPNTVVIQYLNYPWGILEPLTAELRRLGVGMGGPDVFLAGDGLHDGVYRYYPRMSGVVPLGTAVQWENYERRSFGGPAVSPTIRELYEFGRDRLKNNYMFWEIRRAPRDYFRDLVQAMGSASFPPGPEGGLIAKCPNTVKQCVTADSAPQR
jgi:hypothetical protein